MERLVIRIHSTPSSQKKQRCDGGEKSNMRCSKSRQGPDLPSVRCIHAFCPDQASPCCCPKRQVTLLLPAHRTTVIRRRLGETSTISRCSFDLKAAFSALAYSLLLRRAKPKEEGIKMRKPSPKNQPTGTDTWCSHVENGRMGIPRICIRNFECRHCAFYYWLEEFGEALIFDDYSEADFSQLQAA
jgi:hypothetical protein